VYLSENSKLKPNFQLNKQLLNFPLSSVVYFLKSYKHLNQNSQMMLNSKNSPLLSADPSERGYGFTEEILKELKAEKEEVERIRR